MGKQKKSTKGKAKTKYKLIAEPVKAHSRPQLHEGYSHMAKIITPSK